MEVETCAVLYPFVYLIATKFCHKYGICYFPDTEISWFINRIKNIRSCFGLILETYRSNLQNGKQYSAENIYLISRRQLLPGSDRATETDPLSV